ncbi:MAG TPA: hypothetical protein VF746_21150 [Longimicrobium sp.]
MSRTRRAGISAAFGYLQFGLALVAGIALVPFVLARVGSDAYGVWLAFGEVLAYSALVDLGVLGVLPWLIAEHDGRRDRDGVRALLAAGFAFALAAGVAFAGLGALALEVAPDLVRLTEAQRSAALGPLLLLLLGMAAAFPLRAFYSALIGLQDAAFAGVVSLVQVALSVALTAGLLLAGYGLYALAAAAVLPPLVVCLACLGRLAKVAPDLLRGWRLPPAATFRAMAAQGFGGWTAALGWRLLAATDAMVVLAVAGPAAAVVFAMTAKLGAVGMQMSWQLPDAGLVGLAQLKGEGRPERVREVVVSLFRLSLLGAGAVACGVLAFNPSFVSLWVGPARFGGLALNALLAAVVVSHSMGHALFTAAGTLGARVQAGWAALAQGAVNLGAALLLGRAFGLPGVAAATVLSTALVAVPAGLVLVRRTTGLGAGDVWRAAAGPWLLRAGGLFVLGGAVGSLGPRGAVWVPLALAPALAVLYLWAMRPLYAGIPLPGRVRRLLAGVRLLPAS